MSDLRTNLKAMPGNFFEQLETLQRDVEILKRALITPDAEANTEGVVTAVFELTAIPDNTATTVFSVLTTNEDGSDDGGMYACFVQAVVGHGISSSSSNGAVKSFMGHFGRVQKSDGTGETTAVSEISETASAATTSATRDLGTVTMSTSEANEYQIDVQFLLDLTGSAINTGRIRVFVRLVWAGYTSAPELVQL